MEKINAVLVLLNSSKLQETLKNLNLDNVNLAAAALDDVEEKFFQVGEKQVPIVNFSAVHKLAKKYKDYFWLIGGSEGVAAGKLKKFLMTFGVLEDNIIDAEVAAQISATWLANLRHIEEHGADFFVTGNEHIREGVNLDYIPCVREDKATALGGVNLADDFQDLRQSYLIAKHVFQKVKRGAIKFVLIGLAPHSFYCDNAKDFQYTFALQDTAEENPRAELFKNLFSDDVKNIFATVTAAQADLNFDALKENLNRKFSIKSVSDWEADTKFPTTETVETNTQILKDYIELCLANGAKPVGVIFPVAPAMRKNFDRELLANFRETIHQLEETYDFMCVDMFERFNYNCFCDMTHLNSKGTMIANSLLSFNLYKRNLIPVESFCDMSHNYFHQLSYIIPRKEYNAFTGRVFGAAAQRIAGKDKIKVGFVLYDSSMWSGDDLYNLFAQDKRFETTVFLCQRTEGLKNDIIRNVFLKDIALFKSHGLNLVAVENLDEPVPEQDVLIFLTPYFERVADNFSLLNLPARTLITHVIYSFAVSVRTKGYYNLPIFHTAWKVFFPSTINLKMYGEMNNVGMPRGLYSGYPRIDVFFKKDADFHFDWKMARPDAKKIIWAPHHSINEITKWATFQWNYKFMYEFAKSHPEISWVVKPHPNLAFRAIDHKIFPSVEAFENYLQKWNDLPNAQVYTGAYYQAIFATSDGMIHDCGSFTAEYQYVDKPMIYLTRKGTVFNELGTEIFKASYLVDGKDFDAIAAMIQRVFIEGDDYKAADRKKIFDRYLNYPKTNGLPASEFIYKSIADEFKAPTV